MGMMAYCTDSKATVAAASEGGSLVEEPATVARASSHTHHPWVATTVEEAVTLRNSSGVVVGFDLHRRAAEVGTGHPKLKVAGSTDSDRDSTG